MRMLSRHLAVATVVGVLAAACGAQDPPTAVPDPAQDAATGSPDQAADQAPDEPPAEPDGAGDPTPDDEAHEDEQTQAPPPAAAVEALDVQGRTLDGGRFDGRELAGSPVLLWMWAPW